MSTKRSDYDNTMSGQRLKYKRLRTAVDKLLDAADGASNLLAANEEGNTFSKKSDQPWYDIDKAARNVRKILNSEY